LFSVLIIAHRINSRYKKEIAEEKTLPGLEIDFRGPLAALAIVMITPAIARADLYESADFSAAMSSVTGSLPGFWSGGPTVAAEFVFDATMTPGPTTGLQSVPFSTMPGLAALQPWVAFQISFGGETLNLSDFLSGTGAVQYNNGQFDGFDLQMDFTVQGTEYLFQENGPSFDIESLAGGQPTGDILMSGTLDINQDSLTNIRPFCPGFFDPDFTNCGPSDYSYNGGYPSLGITPPPGGNSAPGGNSQPGGSSSPGGNSQPGGSSQPGGGLAVPEPRMFWLLSMILAGLFVCRRFKALARY
jgi:hypothetical protein